MAGKVAFCCGDRMHTHHTSFPDLSCGALCAIGQGIALTTKRSWAHRRLRVTLVHTLFTIALLARQHTKATVSAVVCTRARGKCLTNDMCFDSMQALSAAHCSLSCPNERKLVRQSIAACNMSQPAVDVADGNT
jgi:hypothetical protein